MASPDDDLIVPLRRVLRKKQVKPVLSSDSDDPIIIEDDEPQVIKKKVVHRRKTRSLGRITIVYSFAPLGEIAHEDLEIDTKQAIRAQTERDARIKAQHEREELARQERLQKQIEYNGNIITDHQQKQRPVAFELVLETDTNSGDIVIEVDLMLVQYMKHHQGRLTFMISLMDRCLFS